MWLAARYDDEHLMRIDSRSYRVQHAEKVLAWHVGLPHCWRQRLAIAATMATMEVAPQRALPEQLPQRMLFGQVELYASRRFQCQPLAQAQFSCVFHHIYR